MNDKDRLEAKIHMMEHGVKYGETLAQSVIDKFGENPPPDEVGAVIAKNLKSRVREFREGGIPQSLRQVWLTFARGAFNDRIRQHIASLS
jgi:hypothetical protein